MKNNLKFIEKMYIIDFLFMFKIEKALTMLELMSMLGLSRTPVYKRIKILKDKQLITNVKDKYILTPRGEYVCNILGNLNFYLGGTEKEKNI